MSGSSCKLLYPAEESVEFVTGQIIISQFVKWVLISQDVKHQLHQPMLKLRKIESLVVQVRNLLRTSQQHPQQEARCRYFCRKYAHVENSTKLLPVRVLLDSGSQRSYITNNLKRKLGLIPYKDRNTEFEHIRQWEVFRKRLWYDQVTFARKTWRGCKISALIFEAICSPVRSKVSLHEHPHLQD